jgi:hypothetical protein
VAAFHILAGLCCPLAALPALWRGHPAAAASAGRGIMLLAAAAATAGGPHLGLAGGTPRWRLRGGEQGTALWWCGVITLIVCTVCGYAACAVGVLWVL